VLVDGRLARRRRTGVAAYITRLRRALESAGHDDLRVEWIAGPPGLPRRGRLTTVGNLLLDLVWLHGCVPLIALARGASAVHAPVNWGPWWSPCPTLVTVHDLSWERLPDAYPGAFRRYARLFGRGSARRAARVIAVSRATADDLVELYGVRRQRIAVVPHGVDPDTGPAREREPFVLGVGEFEPRKRVLALVEGHRRYFEQAPPNPPPCRLVLAGDGGSQADEVRRAAGPGCELLGYVSDETLAELYRRAALLCYPSAYEGFGLPVAEAMAHGCPVLVAANSALSETGGRSGLLLDDPSAEGIAQRLGEVLADRPALAARGEAARAEAARFSWDAAANGTLEAYRAAVRRR
jgi:glycosyltransferase involved in cell wall biosynthesis